jgi:hypothetical protein
MDTLCLVRRGQRRRMVKIEREAFMATTPIERSRHSTVQENQLISFEEAMEKLSRDERFRATVYSMNTLLVQKGIYSPEEFEFQFRQFAQKNLR